MWCIWASQVPGGSSGKELACQRRTHRRRGFILLVRKIPWKRAWQPTPVFLPEESPWTEELGGLQSMGSKRVRHDLETVYIYIHIHVSMHDWANCVCTYACVMLSCVQLLVTPWTVCPCLFLCPWGFFRQECWIGFPCPPPGIFPTQGLNPGLLHCRRILYQLSYQGSPIEQYIGNGS